MVLVSQNAVLTSHVTVLLSHSVIHFFFLTFYGTILILRNVRLVPTSHMNILLSHSVVPLFFLIFGGTILTLHSTNITCDYTFVTFCGSLIFFLTFDGIIHTLRNTNTTCDCTFVTFGDFFIFFSYLMVLSSHCAVPTSYVWYHPHIAQYQHYI